MHIDGKRKIFRGYIIFIVILTNGTRGGLEDLKHPDTTSVVGKGAGGREGEKSVSYSPFRPKAPFILGAGGKIPK